MKDSKIFKALQYLDTSDLNRFGKFVESPYFNINERIISFFKILEPYLKAKKEIELDKYAVWKKIFSDKEFDDKYFRKINSDLIKLFEEFIYYEKYNEDHPTKASNLMAGITKRGIFNMFNSALSSAENLQQHNLNRDADYYYQRYNIERQKFNFSTEFEKKSKKQIKHNWLNLKEISDNLDIFYLSEKLKLYTTLMSIQNVKKVDIDLRFSENIVRFIKRTDYKQYPALTIYYQIYLTLKESDNVSHFYELKNLINENINYFPLEESKDIYEAALNYCIVKINSGLRNFNSDLLVIYKEMISKGFFEKEGSLDPTKFRNIVISALRVDDFKWIEWFIESYIDKIEEKFRENALTFNLARLYYYKKDYDKVKKYLRNVEFADIFYELRTKSMLIATYYDTEDFEPLYSLLDSFSVFLNRNSKTIPEQKILLHKKLIKFVRKLMTINRNDKAAIAKLRSQIQEAGDLPDKEWLLDRLGELNKR